MVTGKTRTGFAFEVDGDQMKNAEFLETFFAVQNGNGPAVFEMIRTTLGEAQKKALYDHVRNEKGIVPVDALTNEVSDIFEALAESAETKN